MALSHFDEKSGIVFCDTEWGKWWQTVSEVYIQVNVPAGTRGKDVNIVIKPNYIGCTVKGNTLFEGQLCRTVIVDESTWSIEDKKEILILLVKADLMKSEYVWDSLLFDKYIADAWTKKEMRKKFDLEKFQIENPGFDFSGAKLSSSYDT